MLKFDGKSVYKGIAMGPVVVFSRKEPVKKEKTDSPKLELERLESALLSAKVQLDKLYEQAVLQVGKDSGAIFEAHRMMLADEDYLNTIRNRIRLEQVNAEYAVDVTGEEFSHLFESMQDEYMKARAMDVMDVSTRLIRNLQGEWKGFELNGPSVIVAEDLSPSDIMQMKKENILAFVARHGSAYSHTAILARMMNIPALVGVPFWGEDIEDGQMAIVDGMEGTVIFSPDVSACKMAEEKIAEEQKKAKLLQQLKGKENKTADGYCIGLSANVGGDADIDSALENDAGGIGLFRSEFLYMGREDFPSEEEQFEVYKRAACRMEGKKVVIRTLDIGAEKQTEYMHLEKEGNPAMGYRAIRVCLRRPDIFKTQLRAILRAAYYGNIAIMYPLIISTKEVERIYEMVEEVRQELEDRGVPYKVPEQGIMIETPAAVMISDKLAQMVDFFSVGTNDLTQYALAIDRQNEKLDDFYDSHHEGVLRMIKMVTKNAHQYHKWVGVCGELAADTQMTEFFIRIGVDELSVAPSMILKLREGIRQMKITKEDCTKNA